MWITSRRNDANVSIFGFLAASGVFAVSFATMIEVSYENKNSVADTDGPDLDAAAHRLAELLVASPGDGWYQLGPACDLTGRVATGFTPDQVRRLGLGVEPCEHGGAFSGVSNLSYAKVLKLHEGAYLTNPLNGALDYQEARAGLGLDPLGLNFHIRTWPVLPDVSRILETGAKDPYLRPLYIGDYELMSNGQVQTPLVQHTAGWTSEAGYADFWVNITNNGTATTAFSVLFKVQTKHELVVELHSPSVAAPTGTTNVTLRLNKTSDWEWETGSEDDAFEYVIKDPSRRVGEGSVDRAGLDMSAASQQRLYLVEADQLQWVLEDGAAEIEVSYDAASGDGKTNVDITGWALEIRDLGGALIHTATDLDQNGGSRGFDMASAGTYEARLLDSTGALRQSDRFSASNYEFALFTPAGGAGSWVPQAPVPKEAAYIDALAELFDKGVMSQAFNHTNLTYVEGGDAVPDDNQALAEWLSATMRDADGAPTMANYNIVFVGSDVDHNAMTSAGIKYTIRDWVLAGGTLVVFGSAEQAVQWLQPLFHVALDGAGDGLGVPDQTHPLLRVPNRLDWATFDTRGTAWHFNRDADRDRFTHVVLDGQDDVLGVSDPGAFGKGRVMLSSWQPHDLTYDEAPASCDPATLGATCPSLQLLLNFMTIAYHGMYLDYGPLVPETSPQGVTSRIGVVFHPELGQLVELHMLAFVFA